jgi:iron(III) transport system ATP-binding protein
MIELAAVSLHRSGQAVADGVDLRVARGEAIAISGPSGSGKTTLLRLIAGLELADSGELRLDGRAVDFRDPPHRRGIAFMFQTAALWPHMSVAANIAFGLDDLPPGVRAERTRQLLALIGLDGLGDRYPATLSGGEARRVALARALAPRRPILLLDEPTTNLNVDLRDRMLELIAAERLANGTTLVMATHDHVDALRIADRCLELRDGRLQAAPAP